MTLAAASIYLHISGMILKCFHFSSLHEMSSSLWLWPKQQALKSKSRICRISKKRGQPCGVYPNSRTYFPGNVRSIWFSSRNFQNFRLNGSLFRNSTISRFSGTFPRKFPYHLFQFRKSRNFGSNDKRLLFYSNACMPACKYQHECFSATGVRKPAT